MVQDRRCWKFASRLDHGLADLNYTDFVECVA